MSTYEVSVTRAEGITFRLEADSPRDAEARYLTDGDALTRTTRPRKQLSWPQRRAEP